MYREKSVAVVVPCKNEALQIESVLARMPDLVDRVYVVDDGSNDGMDGVVERYGTKDPRVVLVRHEVNRGVGGAIASGYARARDEGIDVTVVMAGDGQMDPADLVPVVHPVAAGLADYCKGNRFKYKGGLQKIPPKRKFGNFVLSVLTKMTSGYWHVSDTQTGYTSISLEALRRIDVENIYPRYGCPNDILAKLNVAEMRVTEVPVNPLYNVGEQSKMRILRVIGPILWLLFGNFLGRLFRRHVVGDAHPMVLAYALSALFIATACGLCATVVGTRLITGEIPIATLTSSGIALVVGLQFSLAAYWMDHQANESLCVTLPHEVLSAIRADMPGGPAILATDLEDDTPATPITKAA